MSLTCPSCKKKTVHIRQYQVKKIATKSMGLISSEEVVEARCEYCLWGYRLTDTIEAECSEREESNCVSPVT